MLLVNGKEKKVEYEGVHLICFSCGRYGHNRDHCPLRAADGEKIVTSPSSQNKNDVLNMLSTMAESDVPSKGEKSQHSDSGAVYGDWMTVQRRRFHKNGFRDSGGGNNKQSSSGMQSLHPNGSRFATLNNMDDMEIAPSNVPMQRSNLVDITNVSHVKKVGHKVKENLPGLKTKKIDNHKVETRSNPMDDYLRVKQNLGFNVALSKKKGMAQNSDVYSDVKSKKKVASESQSPSITAPSSTSQRRAWSDIFEEPVTHNSIILKEVDARENAPIVDNIDVDSDLGSDDSGMQL